MIFKIRNPVFQWLAGSLVFLVILTVAVGAVYGMGRIVVRLDPGVLWACGSPLATSLDLRCGFVDYLAAGALGLALLVSAIAVCAVGWLAGWALGDKLFGL